MSSEYPNYNPYASPAAIAQSPREIRLDFVKKTYWHLAAAMAAFAILETLLIQAGFGKMALHALGASRFGWLIVIGGFALVGSVADRWARSSTSVSTQYLGLAVYVVAEAIIFLPMVTLAPIVSGDPMVLGKAAVITCGLVLGLTAVASSTKVDFTFMGGFLKVCGMIALGAVVLACLTPITLGFWFSVAMVIFAAACILYQTSAIQYHYQPGQHVAAALSLFASVALMFWYILRLFMRRN
ncbi:US12 family protein [Luteolibacter ambystomatis]|uniref:US12 family protein n=1 Tax=Luteolibacter ambystomatis TaxID=2824561 RepID=A0A975G7Z2_9BACT|nr:Bax inhibitor-1 family protein [Luteolibacter ambystomatis]QUE50628.1 US12 family protein [Luteolibacter ambystomatis]